MAASHKTNGDVDDVDPGGDVSAGDVHVFGVTGSGKGRVGVYLIDGISGDQTPVAMRGVWNLPVFTGDEGSTGDFLYYDATAAEFRATNTSDIDAGFKMSAHSGGRADILIG